MTRLRTESPSGPASCGAVQCSAGVIYWLQTLLARRAAWLAVAGLAVRWCQAGRGAGLVTPQPAAATHRPSMYRLQRAEVSVPDRQGFYVVLPVGAAAAGRACGGGGAAQERVRQPAGDLDSTAGAGVRVWRY